MKANHFLKQFNLRFLLVRILVNALALAVTAAVTPKIYFVDKSVLNWLLMALMLGILNALLKPILQILTMQFLFVTFGLVIVVANTLILLLLSILFPARFAVDNLLWALVGGLVLGLLSSFLESLLGLTMPIVPHEPAELRQQVGEQAHRVDWLAAESSNAGPEVPAPAVEPRAADASAAGPDVAEPAVAEPPTPGPDEVPSPPSEFEAEPVDSVVSSADPEPAPEPQEEHKEDRS